MRLPSIALAALLLAATCGAAALAAETGAPAARNQAAAAGHMGHMGHMGNMARMEAAMGVDVVPVGHGIDMVMVHGQNVAVQFGPDGVLVVDSGAPGDSAALLAAIKRITPEPIRFVIDTSASSDRVGGNAALALAGQGLIENESGFGGGRFVGSSPATIIAQSNVLTTMSTTSGVDLAHALPSLTYDAGSKGIFFNGDSIEIMHFAPAHSDGDSVVIFRQPDVLVCGDIIDMQHFPQIDLAHGGSIDGEIAALNRLVDLTVPALPLYWNGGGTVVIPGRGRLAQQEDVVQYRDMVTIVRDRVKALIDEHRSLAQVHAADPTAGYNARYGAPSGPGSSASFVTAIYQSLTASRGHGRDR